MRGPLWKTVLHLRGIAMCFVVLNHAVQHIPASYVLGPAALVPWEEPADYAVLMLARGWAPACLHAFLLASGFVTYQFFRGAHESWAFARQIIRKYLMWAIPMFVVLAIKARRVDLVAVAKDLVVGGPVTTYWFLVLIAMLYMLAPPVVTLVRTRPRMAVLLAAVITVASTAAFYLVDPALAVPFWFVPVEHALRFLPFFVLGMLASRYADVLGPWLARHRSASRWACALCAVLVTLESALLAKQSAWVILPYGRMYATERAAMPLFSLSVLAVLATLDMKSPALLKWLNEVGNQSLGILLMMDLFQYVVVAFFWHIPRAVWPAATTAYAQHRLPAPIIEHALWFVLPLFAAGLWGPLYVMEYAKRFFGNRVRALF